jgi:hypothetical protein
MMQDCLGLMQSHYLPSIKEGVVGIQDSISCTCKGHVREEPGPIHEGSWKECGGLEQGVGHLGQLLRQSQETNAGALEPIFKFKKYRIFEHVANQEFCFALGSAMIGARGVNLLRKLINEQTLAGIMSCMPCQIGNSGQKRGPPGSTRTSRKHFGSSLTRR